MFPDAVVGPSPCRTDCWISSSSCAARLARLTRRRRSEDILESYPAQQLGADTIGYTIDDLSAILRRIDVDPERTLAERHIHDFHNRVRHRGWIRIRRFESGEAL